VPKRLRHSGSRNYNYDCASLDLVQNRSLLSPLHGTSFLCRLLSPRQAQEEVTQEARQQKSDAPLIAQNDTPTCSHQRV
jgi:hypothetical protein